MKDSPNKLNNQSTTSYKIVQSFYSFCVTCNTKYFNNIWTNALK